MRVTGLNPDYSSVTLGKLLNLCEPQKEGPSMSEVLESAGCSHSSKDGPAPSCTSAGPPGVF